MGCPPGAIDSLINTQLPFVRELSGRLPSIAIDGVEVDRRGDDIWKVDAWVVNTGFLPYPTHQGQRCKRPTPVALELGGERVEILEGRARVVVGLLEGSGGFKKASWIVKASAGRGVTLTARSFSAGVYVKEVTLGEGGGE